MGKEEKFPPLDAAGEPGQQFEFFPVEAKEKNPPCEICGAESVIRVIIVKNEKKTGHYACGKHQFAWEDEARSPHSEEGESKPNGN